MLTLSIRHAIAYVERWITIMKNNLVGQKLKRIMLKMHKWKGSAEYWEKRYEMGGNSGTGSYNKLAIFKADIVNSFVKENDIDVIIEWGCGDGNQLQLAQYPKYIGIDVSSKAVEICKKIFKEDDTKEFYCSSTEKIPAKICLGGGSLALSLDVIYHLVEDNVFEKYMEDLFGSSKRYVCIYSCNFDEVHAQHVKCRKFTDYVEKNFPDWKLIKRIPNIFPYDIKDKDNTSWSDFYFYAKKGSI